MVSGHIYLFIYLILSNTILSNTVNTCIPGGVRQRTIGFLDTPQRIPLVDDNFNMYIDLDTLKMEINGSWISWCLRLVLTVVSKSTFMALVDCRIPHTGYTVLGFQGYSK